jgi:hypothetical protein
VLRLLVLAVLVLLVWSALTNLLSRAVGRRGDRPAPGPSAGPGAAEPLVRCAVCGVQIPASRALGPAGGSGDGPWCSPACQRSGATVH